MPQPTPTADQSPAADTPVGPVWIVDTDDLDQPLRVRRLPDAPGLLKLGVTLRHLSRCGHPRLQSPTRWWRDGDDVWIAAPRCPGVALADHRPDRRTWSDAVDIVTPLAIALRDAHRNGVVHGALAPWNVFFDDTTDRLTAVDFGLWPYEQLPDGPFRPPEWNRDADATPTIATDIHNLARLLLYIALSPDEAQRRRPNFETLPAYAISTLERALADDPTARPDTIDDLLAGLTFRDHTGIAGAQTTTGDDSAVTGRARDIELFDNDRRGQGIRFRLDTADADDSPGLFVYRQQAPQVFDSLALLWEGAELTMIAPRTVENSEGRTFLTAGDATLPVIEPHWPVTVSNVLKARGCPRRVLVDLRDPGERTHHLAFGTLVHQFLEDLTDDDELTFEEAIQRRLPALRLDFLAAGVDDAQLSKLLSDARLQFEHLRRFTARRTAEAPQNDRVGWCGEHAEATRYSSRYGLEGRADLVVTDPDEGLQIIELKSGKPWHDHPGQVQSYALLWRQLADHNSLPTTGHLLYSKNGKMKEVPLEGAADRRGLVHGRNGLVALFRSFVDPDYDYRAPHYMQTPSLCRQGACRFRRDRCRDQTKLLGLGSDGDPGDAEAYLHHWTRLVETERWADHAAVGAIFEPERLGARVVDGTAAADLTLVPADGGDHRAVLTGDNLHIFSPGDRILVHRGDIDAHHVMRARVIGPAENEMTVDIGDEDTKQTTPDRIEIEFRSATLADHLVGDGWIADVLPSRIGYRTAHRALYRLLETSPRDVVDLLVHPHSGVPARADDDHAVADNTEEFLNDSQLDALRAGIDDVPATLIQGPPGTGKTTVIAHLACELAARDNRVLLAALTNTAVDTLLVHLLDAAEVRGEKPPAFLRLGSADRSPLLAAELRRQNLDPADYFSDDLAAETESLQELEYRLEQIRIVASTAHSSIRHAATTWFERQFDTPAFDVTLIDEASQLTEPMALAPISAAKRFVLIGDHRQLPPIVTAERAMTSHLPAPPDSGVDANANLGGLDRSLFERLADFVTPRMLTTQYRMHRAIMDFPDRNFYDGRLTAHETVADRTLPVTTDDPGPVLDPDHPVVFADIDGHQQGRTNLEEAQALIATVEQLTDTAPQATVGVLSPFRAQVHLLRKLSAETGLASVVDVDTVERFQGNERDVICASMVKTDHPGDFVADLRRLNVAVTRARMKLIVFGCGSCLRQAPVFRQWLDAETTSIVEDAL